MPRTPALLLTGLLALAGCASNQPLQERAISIDTGAEPASVVLNENLQGLVAQAGPSYVTLVVSENGNPIDRRDSSSMPEALTAGSGFVVGDGLILTAGHVGLKKDFTVEAHGPDGRIYSGKVLAVRPENDMALVSLRDFEGTAVHPAPQACLKPGDPVFSLGKPHAQGDTARFGTLENMSFGRAVAYQGFGYPDAMVLHMATKKGESGGPLFDSRGELVGMIVSTLSDTSGQPLNLAHAVPLPALADFLCSSTQCRPEWQALVRQTTSQCPNA